jgi:hypothetical protein
VTAGYGTTTPTAHALGTFVIPLAGWNSWTYETLTDSANKPVAVTLDGTQTTIQLSGPASNDNQTINAGFFMLVPVATSKPVLTATPVTPGGATIKITFQTQSGSTYQVQYKSSLNGGTWSSLGASITGDNTIKSVTDTMSGSARFYRVQVQ